MRQIGLIVGGALLLLELDAYAALGWLGVLLIPGSILGTGALLILIALVERRWR